MKRVLHILHSMEIGGMQTFIMNVYRHIDKTKVQFDFLVRVNNECYYDKEIKKLGGKIFYIPSRRDKLLGQKKLWKDFFINHKEYNTIHYHTSSLSDITPVKYAHKCKIKQIIIHAHSTTTPKSIVHKFLHAKHKKNISRFVTNMFACSRLAAEFSYGKNRLNNVEIIKNGIEAKKFIYSKEIALKKRKELNISNKAFVIGHTGRFAPIKNHNFLIDIFNKILIKNKSAILVLIGKEDDKKEIRKKIMDLGIEKNVKILGTRNDVNEILMAMNAFVFPSFNEGLPVSVIEAQATGIKCFLSDSITNEVDITGNVEFVSLKQSDEYWCDEILNNYNIERKNFYNNLVEAGYDIESTTKILEKLYI